MKAILIKINKNLPSKSTTGIYHEFVFADGRKCFVDPENENYWGRGWGALLDNWPDVKGYTLHGLRLFNSKRYNADYLQAISPPETPEKQSDNTFNDIFDIS
jgi:hypothetical protein